MGGTKFVTAVSTLTPNSAYCASLFSDNWNHDDDAGDEIFLDQDPVPFEILLAYMRRGMIKVKDIDTNVLALAEFLGMERLLLAVKVRWYCNIGKGPIVSGDEEIAGAFDQEHGGIPKAISTGLFPYFLKRNEVDVDKDLASMEFSEQGPYISVTIADSNGGVTKSPAVEAGCLVGALNGLHLKGYTKRESQLETANACAYTMVFSCIRHSAIASDARDIFIPAAHEMKIQMEDSSTKQFAMLLENMQNADEVTIAPAEFSDDPQERENPFAVAIFRTRAPLLDNKCFDTREEGYEQLFKRYISETLDHYLPRRRGFGMRDETATQCRIFSRKIHGCKST